MSPTHTPLVSIITPSYNQAAYLEQTIQSVLAQDYPQIEYIVVDGASTDNSQDIIQKYSHQLAWWVSEKDHGQADAINKGFQRAQGEILAWLNSDDLYLPGAISQAVQSLGAHPEVGMVFGDAITMDANGRPLNRLTFGDWGLQELMNFRIICQPAVFLRRSILEQTGYLDLDYHFLLDHQLWIRMAAISPIRHASSLWAAARHHPEAKNVSQAAAFGEEAMRILDWMRAEPALKPLVHEHEDHILAGAYRLQARYLLDGGQPAAALRSYLQALKYWPQFALQHSHRMTYAFLSLLKANQLLDNLRQKNQIKQRNQLISDLKDLFSISTNLQNQENPMVSWPGLNFKIFLMPKNKKPILVTGAHRTGTTWVGKMLAASDEAAYISEPLNVLHRPGVMRAPVPHWYQYIHTHNQQDFEPAFREMLQLRYHPWLEFKSLRSTRDLLRMLRDWRIFYAGRKHRQCPLLKDPFAVFSIPWFNQTLGCQVVVTVRHPAAFASSLKRLNWPFDFTHLLSQPQLMQDWLEPYRPQMQALVEQPQDIIGQASLLWSMVYDVVEAYRQQVPDLLVVRHEDLSIDPIGGFMQLYDQFRAALHPRCTRNDYGFEFINQSKRAFQQKGSRCPAGQPGKYQQLETSPAKGRNRSNSRVHRPDCQRLLPRRKLGVGDASRKTTGFDHHTFIQPGALSGRDHAFGAQSRLFQPGVPGCGWRIARWQPGNHS